MAEKILILGAKGMLGSVLCNVFASQEPTCWDIDEIDITDQQLVENKLFLLKPSIVINAAAYTDVDEAEENEDLAVRVNGFAVGYLASVIKRLGATLVHYSTDYVFDGLNSEGYLETAKPNPINAYGRSKLRGEEQLEKKGGNYYLIRTSWLYGPEGKNFIETILNKAAQSSEIKVVNDQFSKPTYTFDLARQTKDIIEAQKPFGIYHATNTTKFKGITWFEFAKRAIEIKGLGTQVVPCGTQDFPRPAKRPMHSALTNTKLGPMRDWHQALEEYLVTL